MQKFSSFGRKKKKNRPKFDIEWLCSKVFKCRLHFGNLSGLMYLITSIKLITYVGAPCLYSSGVLGYVPYPSGTSGSLEGEAPYFFLQIFNETFPELWK